MVKICEKCGESNPNSNQFCKSCGSTLDSEFIKHKTFLELIVQ